VAGADSSNPVSFQILYRPQEKAFVILIIEKPDRPNLLDDRPLWDARSQAAVAFGEKLGLSNEQLCKLNTKVILPGSVVGDTNVGLGFCNGDSVPYFSQQLKNVDYKANFDQMRGQFTGWTRTYDGGVEGPGRIVTISNQQYEYYSICQPHNCTFNMLYVLTTVGGGAVWAMSQDDQTRLRFYGVPDSAKQAFFREVPSCEAAAGWGPDALTRCLSLPH
jgi:hypothetical protein